MTLASLVTDVRAAVCDTGAGRNFIFVAVDTDAGFTGWGEASQSGQDAAVLANVRQLKDAYVGRDVFELVERQSALLRSGRTGRAMAVALSGIELALWDAMGKILNQPVYRLLGGSCHDAFPCYATIAAGVDDWTPKGLAAAASSAVDQGFPGVKVVPFVDHKGRVAPSGGIEPCSNRGILEEGLARLRAVRGAIGPDTDLMVECAFALGSATARRTIERMVEYDPFWIEAPLPWDDATLLAELRAMSSMRIASGEFACGLQSVREMIEKRAVDVLQPDVKWVGGILEARKVGTWAEAYQIGLAPHNNSGPLATAASAHLLACSPNAVTLEISGHQPEWASQLTQGRTLVTDGWVHLDELSIHPGFGINVDESIIVRTAVATC